MIVNTLEMGNLFIIPGLLGKFDTSEDRTETKFKKKNSSSTEKSLDVSCLFFEKLDLSMYD